MKQKFWNWVKNEGDAEMRTLFLNGEISDETWYGDEVTPQLFLDELNSGQGDITVWINSPGGDVFAAAQIYNMLKAYKGNVTVRIDSLAASAASVIAMAGDTVEMSPVAMLMIHNPSMIAMGNTADMQHAIDMLNEVKESILNAYEAKTGMRRNKLAALMDSESWFNARKALEMGFCDSILFAEEPVNKVTNKQEDEDDPDEEGKEKPEQGKDDDEDDDAEKQGKKKLPFEQKAMMYQRKLVEDSFLAKFKQPEVKDQVSVDSLRQRLNLIAH